MPAGDGAVRFIFGILTGVSVPDLRGPTDGMFAILVPLALAPLIITLLWAENKAKKLGIIAAALRNRTHPPEASIKLTFLRECLHTADKLDAVGLALLGAAVALILLPLTLSKDTRGQWRSGKCD